MTPKPPEAAPLPPRGEDEQLRLARLVQEALLPPAEMSMPGVEAAIRFLPSRAVGGDFLDCFSLGRRWLAFYLGDVQGKGLEAALYALLVSGLMRGLHKTGVSPAQVVASLNKRLCYRTVPHKYSCLAYGVVDTESHRLIYSNAGLPFPLLLRDGQVESLQLTGSPVGLFNPCEYDEVSVDLRAGDVMVFLTDGLADSLAQEESEIEFGQRQVEDRLRAATHLPLGEVADSLFTGLVATGRKTETDRRDDITLLALRFA